MNMIESESINEFHMGRSRAILVRFTINVDAISSVPIPRFSLLLDLMDSIAGWQENSDELPGAEKVYQPSG